LQSSSYIIIEDLKSIRTACVHPDHAKAGSRRR
jgi:hypothetical protein